MSALGSLVVKLALEYAQFTAGTDDAKKRADDLAKNVQNSMDGMARSVKSAAAGVAGGLAAAFTIGAVDKLLKDVTASQAALNDLSHMAGMTVERLSALQSVGRYVGLGAQEIAEASVSMTDALAQAKDESDGVGQALAAIGLKFEDFRRLNPDEQFKVLARALSEYEDGAGKAAVMTQIMGEEGAKLLPFFRDLADAGELQAEVTEEQAAAAVVYQKNLKDTQKAADLWKQEIAAGMVPALNLAVQAFDEVINGADGLLQDAQALGADGSIQQWTESAITGLSYVADAAHVAWRVLESTGKSLGGLAAAIVLAVQGDFRGAWEALKASGEDVTKTWDDPTIGARFRENLDKIKSSAQQATPAIEKKTLAVKNYGEAASAAAERQKQLDKAAQDAAKAAQRELEAETAARVKAYGEEVKAQEARLKAYQSSADRAEQAVQDARDEEDAYARAAAQGISLAEAVAQIGIARAEEAYQQALNREADAETLLALHREIEARKQLLTVLGQKTVREANAKAAEEAGKAWEKTSQTIGQTLSDYIMSGGKDAATYLKRLFSTLVLQPVVNWGVQNVMGMLGGGSSAGGGDGVGSLMGVFNTVKNMFGAVTGGLASSIGSVVGWAGNAMGSQALSAFATGMKGATLAPGLAGPTTAGAGGAMGAGAAAAQVVNIAGGIAGGIYGGRMVSGGYSAWGGSSGNSAVNTGTAIGAAVGSIVPVIGTALGALIGGLLGGAVNRMFGRKLKDSGIEGTFGGDVGFTGRSFEFYKGGWFRSDKTKYSALGAEVSDTFASTFFALKEGTAMLADSVGVDASHLADYTHKIKLSLKGLSEDQADELIKQEFDKIAESLAATALAAEGYSVNGETALQTLTRLSNSLTTINTLFDQLGWTLIETSIAGAEGASGFAGLFGGLDQATSALDAYYQAFYSQQERMLKANQQVNDALRALGVAPDAPLDAFAAGAKERFRAELEHVRETSQMEVLAAMLQLAPSFAAAADYAERLGGAIDGMSDTMRSLLDERRELEAELLRAQGDEAGYLAAVRAISTEGFSEAELAAWDYNRALQSQIDATYAAAEALQQNARDVLQSHISLSQEYVQAMQQQISDAQAKLSQLSSSSEWAATQAGRAYGQSGVESTQFFVGFAKSWEEFAGSMGALHDAFAGLEKAQQAEIKKLEDAKKAEEAQIKLWQDILNVEQQQVGQLMSLEQAIQTLQGAVVDAVGSINVGAASSVSPHLSQPGSAGEAAAIAAGAIKNADGTWTMKSDTSVHDYWAAYYAALDEQALRDQIRGHKDWWSFELLKGGAAIVGSDANRAAKAIIAEIEDAVRGMTDQDAVDKISLAIFTGQRQADSQGSGATAGTALPEMTLAEYQQLANMQMQYWRLLGDEESIRKATLAAMHPQLQTMQEQLWLIEEQQRVSAERQGLEQQLLQLQGDTAALRQLELDALDPSNRALQQRLWLLEEQQKQIEAFNSVMSSLGDTRFDLEQQILEQQGKTGEAAALKRARDLDKLLTGITDIDMQAQVVAAYDFNKLLEDQVKGWKDLGSTMQSALDSVLDSYNRNLDDMASIVKGVKDWTEELQWGDLSGLSDEDKHTSLSYRYADTQARAAAGDKTAMSELQEIAAQLAKLTQESAVSSADYSVWAGRLATSLTSTADTGHQAYIDEETRRAQALARFYADFYSSIPGFANGGLHSGGIRLVGERGPELEVTGPARYFDAGATARMLGGGSQQSGNAEVVAELRALREQNARLEARLASIEASTDQFARQTDNVSAGGNAYGTEILNVQEIAQALKEALKEALA